MQNTVFDSPHGLQNNANVSTAYDMAVLTQACMRIPEFRKIVKTTVIEVETKCNVYEWCNTNMLLGGSEEFEAFKGTLGCKTGVTQVAGPCFAGFFERQGSQCIIVVLKSESMESRWFEVPALVRWYLKCKKRAQSKILM
jgi:D-alanyl-D-alanine carboxypeptidase